MRTVKVNEISLETILPETEIVNYELTNRFFKLSLNNITMNNDEVIESDLESLKLVVLAMDELFNDYAELGIIKKNRKAMFNPVIAQAEKSVKDLEYRKQVLEAEIPRLKADLELYHDDDKVQYRDALKTLTNVITLLNNISKDLVKQETEFQRLKMNSQLTSRAYSQGLSLINNEGRVPFRMLVQLQSLYQKNGLTPLTRLQIQSLLLNNEAKQTSLWGEDDESTA